MARFVFSKQPREDTTFGIDFAWTRELQSGEFLVGATVIAVTKDGASVPHILSGHSVQGSQIRVRVRECDPGDYFITVLGTTNVGHVREADVTLSVREIRGG